MNKLVKEISELFKANSRVDKTSIEGGVGICILVIFILVYFIASIAAKKIVSSLWPVTVQVMYGLYSAATFLAIFGAVYYCIKYLAILFIPTTRDAFSPLFKNRKESIESILTKDVEDKGRMHMAIMNYFKEYSSPAHFAALYIYLVENQLICVTDQKKYLSVLSADFPKTSSGELNDEHSIIPSESGFSTAKKQLEEDDKKLYHENGYEEKFTRMFKDYIKD